mmetsp:Transcript_65049/g.180908  ORF Transcript_65049/g.180908 Transcript_65049/m.180908 type:complete len:80 (-) Transcript_65049:245-484(-)
MKASCQRNVFKSLDPAQFACLRIVCDQRQRGLAEESEIAVNEVHTFGVINCTHDVWLAVINATRFCNDRRNVQISIIVN